MATKHASIDDYLASVSDEQRPDLRDLRAQVQACYPEATEHISHGQPLFKLDGYAFVGFYATKKHLSFFVWSDKTLGKLGDKLAGVDTGESTVRFHPGQPLSKDVVTAIMDERAGEIRNR